MIKNIGLICEGGGTKAAYSAGVLQCLLDCKIYLPYTAGISAGAEILLAYVSRQRERLFVAGVESASQKSAVGIRPLLHERGLFGIQATCDFIEKHAPLDYETFLKSETQLDIGLYNLDTNKIEYFDKSYFDPKEQTLVKAACALFLLTRPYHFNGHLYMDAGLIDMIPIEQSIRRGNEKHIFISTKEENYVRKPAPQWQLRFSRMFYAGNKEVTFTWKAGAGMDIAYENYYDIVDGYQQFFQPDVPAEKDFGEGEHQYITDGPAIMGSSLASVNFPGGKIELNYNAYQLSGMYLYDKQNKLVRTVSFTHSDYLLQSITIDKEQTYSFDYNEQGFTYSHGVDFWGYYNGVDNGYTSHPALTYTSYQFIQGNCYSRTLTCSGADRNPNASCMQANMLVQVNYPTDGYTRFEYEPNSYKTAEKEGIVQGGGLRVKKIINGTNGTNGPDGDRQVIKTYLYGNNACGYGSCSVHIDERAFVSEFFCYHSVVPDIYSYRRLTVHANHLYGSYLLFNHPVWYPEVTELLPDGSKQVYQYRYNPDAIGECDASMPSIFNSYPRDYRTRVSFEFNHLFDRNPQLERLKVYDKQGELVSEKDFAYMAIKGSPLNLVGINFRQVYQDIAYYNNQCSPYAEYDYLLASIRAEQYYLSSETEKTDGVTVKREYQRNRSDMPVRTVVTHADGTVTEESYLYADDDLSSLTAEQQTCKSILQSNHRITQPVCKRKKVNGVQVMQKVIRYGASGSGNKYVYPVEEYYRTGNYPEESRVEYLRYNSLGKPVEVTVDGHHIIYLWGYQGQYPVAVIENATYQEVQSVISQTLQEEIASAIIPASTHWSILNNLRSRLPLALVKTYTYQPLVGMLSETDPAGQTVYYTYDVCGRLTEIYRMASGKKEMIEAYEYEY